MKNRFDYLSQLQELTGKHMSMQLSFTFSHFAKKRQLLYSELSTKMNQKKSLMDSFSQQEIENSRALIHQKKEWEEKRKCLENRGSFVLPSEDMNLEIPMPQALSDLNPSPLPIRAFRSPEPGPQALSVQRKKEASIYLFYK